jgi:hypothetical protein
MARGSGVKAPLPYGQQVATCCVPVSAYRFPAALPEFFLQLLTEDGDIVRDPFGDPDTTRTVAESLGVRWIAVELVEFYLEASWFRFLVSLGILAKKKADVNFPKAAPNSSIGLPLQTVGSGWRSISESLPVERGGRGKSHGKAFRGNTHAIPPG